MLHLSEAGEGKMDFLFDWMLNVILNVVGQWDDAEPALHNRNVSLSALPTSAVWHLTKLYYFSVLHNAVSTRAANDISHIQGCFHWSNKPSAA